jgi:hypothetical protein
MGYERFKMLKFTRKQEFRDGSKKIILEAYIPGVNSGMYDKTIHLGMTIVEYKASWFRMKKTTTTGYLTLTKPEFKEFVEEVNKINDLNNTKTGYVKSETEFLGIEFTLKDGSKQFVPKQETLEEAAKDFVLTHDFSLIKTQNHLANRCFQLGANWQAERCYSDEEAIQLLIKLNQEIREVDDVRSWFEQFKKK